MLPRPAGRWSGLPDGAPADALRKAGSVSSLGLSDAATCPLDRSSRQRGRRMAFVLEGAWRPSPPSLEMSEEALDDITLGLLRSRTGALGWWRVRRSELRDTPAGGRLREAYHNHGFQAALHARNLTRIATRLCAAGVESLLVKGPAIGRLYPERGLRPFGDLDLCV